MPETIPSNADALVLATAFPHASEAQRTEILTDLFVRRVVIPRGAAFARRLADAVAAKAQRSLRDAARDPIGRAALREGIKAFASSFVRTEDLDEVVDGIDSALDAVFPDAPPEAAPPSSDEPRTYEVTIPHTSIGADGILRAEFFIVLSGEIVPGTVLAESAGHAGRLVFCCDVRDDDGTVRHVEGYAVSPATRADHEAAGPMTLSVGDEPGVLVLSQPCGKSIARERVAVVGPDHPAGPLPPNAKPCDGAASNDAPT